MTNVNTKKVMQFISSVFLYAIIAIIGIVFIMFIAYFIDQQIAKNKGETRSPLFGAYVILTTSMVPNINVNDAVITVRATEKNIKVNDVITFISKNIDTQGTPITHRVVGIVYEDDNKTKVLGYRTKGDANNTQDFSLIAPNEVLGKVFFRIPYIGYVKTFLTRPIGWLLVIVIPCMLMIGSDVIKLLTATKVEKVVVEENEEKGGNK